MLAWFVQYQIAIIMEQSQHFPVPDLSFFPFPSPSLLRSDPLIYSYLRRLENIGVLIQHQLGMIHYIMVIACNVNIYTVTWPKQYNIMKITQLYASRQSLYTG